MMEDKEYISYGISPYLPKYKRSRCRCEDYSTHKDARDAAKRFSEKEDKPYYVYEVVRVYNVLEKVEYEEDDNEEV